MKHSQRSGQKFWGSTVNPYRHLRYVKDFGKMGADGLKRTRFDFSG